MDQVKFVKTSLKKLEVVWCVNPLSANPTKSSDSPLFPKVQKISIFDLIGAENFRAEYIQGGSVRQDYSGEDAVTSNYQMVRAIKWFLNIFTLGK